MVRFYIELDNIRDGEVVDNRSVTREKLATVGEAHPHSSLNS